MRNYFLPLCFIAPAALAVATTDGTIPEQVLVTASRTPIALAAAGSGASVITREDIERRHPEFLADLLRDEAGFSVGRGGGPGQQTQIRVRGGEADHVLVLIDGIEANDLTRGGAFDFANLPAADIERVEIVRGPQSALWGSDAISGVINVITRKGDGKLRATAGIEGGSFGTVSTNGSLSGARNGVDGMLSISHYATDGINVSPVGTERDGYRNTTLNTRLGWDALPDLRFDVTGRVTGARVNNDSGLTLVNGDTVTADSSGKTTLTQGYSQARARLDSFEGHWRNEIAGTWSRMENDDLDQANFIDSAVIGNKYKGLYQSSLMGDTAAFIPAAHVLTFAFDYEKQDFRQRGPVVFGSDPNQDRAYRNIGYVGEYRLTLAENSTLTASGRWDDSDAFADVGTWRVALGHRFPHTGTSLSWSYATGQKAPTFFDRYGFSVSATTPFVGNSNLRPEQSRGWEFGVQQSLLVERITLGVTYFNEELTDEIDGFVFDFTTNTLTARNLPGTSHRQGVEVTSRFRFTSQWDARLNYTWLEATQLNRAGLREDEVRRAPHQVAASTAWRTADRRASVDLHLTHTSQRQDDSFELPFFTPVRKNLVPYTLIGLSGSYQLTTQVSLKARLENMLDDDYQEVFGYRSEGVAGFVGVNFQTSP